MWGSDQDACAVPSIGFKTTAASMIHAGIYMIGVQHDLTARYALDICDKAHTTRILFICRVVESCFFGITELQWRLLLLAHKKLSLFVPRKIRPSFRG